MTSPPDPPNWWQDVADTLAYRTRNTAGVLIFFGFLFGVLIVVLIILTLVGLDDLLAQVVAAGVFGVILVWWVWGKWREIKRRDQS